LLLQVLQVLLNLLSNAIKFTNRGGFVFVDVDMENTAAVNSSTRNSNNNDEDDDNILNNSANKPNTANRTSELNNNKSNKMETIAASDTLALSISSDLTSSMSPRTGVIRFTVGDSGIGIAPEDQAAVFQRYKQLDNGPAGRNQSGAGLGLSICVELVRLMKGNIGLRSELGKGSQFWFSWEAQIVTMHPNKGTPRNTKGGVEDVLVLWQHALFASQVDSLIERCGVRSCQGKVCSRIISIVFSLHTQPHHYSAPCTA
jgi:signal transduction histidine kinase